MYLTAVLQQERKSKLKQGLKRAIWGRLRREITSNISKATVHHAISAYSNNQTLHEGHKLPRFNSISINCLGRHYVTHFRYISTKMLN